MERGSPRRIAYEIALLLLALAVGEATREKFVEAGALLAVAVGAALWAATAARRTRAPRRDDRMVAHPVRWAFIYLVTIGPATFYLAYDAIFDRHLPITLAVSVVVPLVVFVVRWLIVHRNPSG